MTVIEPSRNAANVRYAIRNIVRIAKELEKKGKEILYCNIGDPIQYDFEVPPHMIAAVTQGMKDGLNGYAHSAGLQEAREAAARDAVKQGIKGVTAEDIIITSGASEGIELAMTSLLNPGDIILTPAPGYPLYTAVLSKLGLVETPYFLDEENGWQPDLGDIEAKVTDRTKGIVVINPNNPTGSVSSRELLEGLIDLADRKGLVLFSDEIYNRLTFEKQQIPLASLTDQVPVLTFNGLSKCYLCPGWRMGWIIFNNRQLLGGFLDCINNLADARLCAPAPLQRAIPAALDGPQDHLAPTIEKLRRRRDLTVRSINAIEGLSVVSPEGAFYAMPRIDTDAVQDDWKFVVDLLEATGVLFVPGSGFGQRPGTRHFRIVTLPPEETLSRAYQRLAEFTSTYRQ